MALVNPPVARTDNAVTDNPIMRFTATARNAVAGPTETIGATAAERISLTPRPAGAIAAADPAIVAKAKISPLSTGSTAPIIANAQTIRRAVSAMPKSRWTRICNAADQPAFLTIQIIIRAVTNNPEIMIAQPQYSALAYMAKPAPVAAIAIQSNAAARTRSHPRGLGATT